MTDYGNTWVSDYSWGWAPFHYGRWYYDDYYGWTWIPGYEWAPAWVVWRSGGGYYGWAPMAPGINISININIPGIYWTFLPHTHMYHRNMHRYYSRYSPAIYNRTTIINNTYVYNDNRYYSGPSARDYERTTGRKATVHRLESSDNRSGRSTRVSNNAVSVYRPEASRESTTNTRATVNDRSTGTSVRSTSNDRVSGTSSRTSTNDRNTGSSTRSATVNPQRSSSSNRSASVSRSSSRSSDRSTAPVNRSSENARSERSSSRR